ncbi:1906_t:CDS:1, partial [Entrophospora sp. SA101]
RHRGRRFVRLGEVGYTNIMNVDDPSSALCSKFFPIVGIVGLAR